VRQSQTLVLVTPSLRALPRVKLCYIFLLVLGRYLLGRNSLENEEFLSKVDNYEL
jgi:hypothetical protein